jgi:hypothetical protein
MPEEKEYPNFIKRQMITLMQDYDRVPEKFLYLARYKLLCGT